MKPGSVADKPVEIDVDANTFLRQAVTDRRRSNGIDWFWVFWRRRPILWRLTAWSLLASIVLAFLIPARYQSTTKLMPPDSQSESGLGMAMIAALAGVGSAAGGLKSLAGEFLGLKSSGALFVDILRSRTVEDRLIGQFDLRKAYSDRLWEDARRDLSRKTDIAEDRKSGVLTITVTDRSPQRAAEIAHAYVDELNRLVAEVSTSSARRERIFIEQRLKTAKQDLDTASQQFSEYSSKNSTIDLKDQAKATVEAAATLQAEMIVTQSELEGLEQIYSASNVRVRSLKARIEELQRQLEKISGSGPTGTVSGTKTEFPSIRELPLLGVRWADLYREAKVRETVYELLTQQYEVAKIQEAKALPTVKVLDAPNVPERRSRPRPLEIILFGEIAGFLGGLGWILISHSWQQLSAEDPRRQALYEVRQSVTAALPWIQPSRWKSFGRKSALLADNR